MADYKNTVLADSPVMYLRLGEASGTTAEDASSTGTNDGTYVATPTLGATGALTNDVDAAVTLNGSSQYVSVVDHASLDLTDGPLSIEFWMKRSNTATGVLTIIGKGTPAYKVFLSNGNVWFGKDAGSNITNSNTAITDTASWHHVVVTKTGATSKIYIDGADDTGTVTDQTLGNSANALIVGAAFNGAAQFFPGGLDEVAIYNTILSPSRVREHYNKGIIGRFVPGRYDVVINGEGYVLADLERVKAQYGFSPTFVQRQNVQGDYGDHQQEFWLAATQRDWSLGEEQRFYRQADDNSRSRYWRGTNVNVNKQGRVSMRRAVETKTFAAAAVSTTEWVLDTAFATASNLYTVNSAGAITDRGAHGLGATPSLHGLQGGLGANIYITTTSAGTVGVRRWDGSGAFTTFSANGADALAYLNNTLYGYRNTATGGDLVRWDTAGTLTSLFIWRDANGDISARRSTLRAYGGKLLILRDNGYRGRAELWQYDGTAPAKLAEFPPNFDAYEIEIANGIVFVSGQFFNTSNSLDASAGIFYYVNGVSGLLWESQKACDDYPALAHFDNGLVFTNDETGGLMYYDTSTGGISTIGTYTVAGSQPRLAANVGGILHTRNHVTGYFVALASTVATTATVTSSLFDFDSSLDKLFKGVKVDYDAATDGNGGSIDIAYRLNDVESSTYTTVKTGATSGVEYPINQNARSISIKVTLNKGTSTDGPVLKRVSPRAVPIQTQFRREVYLILAGGRDGESHNQLRDGTTHSKDGLEQAIDLRTVATTTTLVQVTDEFGTYAGVPDLTGFSIQRVGNLTYLATVPMRQA